MKNHKLKILIVSFYFPPLNTIGSLRPYSWAKHWSRLGHDVCVLTAKKESFEGPLDLELDPTEMRLVRIEELSYWSLKKYAPQEEDPLKDKLAKIKSESPSFLKKLKRGLENFTGIRPYSPHLWVLPALRKAFEIYRQWPFDVIVSSYSPPASHIIAGLLKRKSGAFWVADYRDLWSENHSKSAHWPFSLIEKSMEKYCVKRADLLTIVSSPLGERLASLLGKKVVTVKNGFDVDELKRIEKQSLFPRDGKIRLIYTGTFYKGKQDPMPIFNAVNILKARSLPVDKKLEIIFYGTGLVDLHELIIKCNLADIVKTPGYVPRKTALMAQRDADLLIFLDWEDTSVDGILTGKIYEYMFSGTPILSVGGSGRSSAAKLIEAAAVGFVAEKSIQKAITVIETLIKGEKLNYSPSNKVLSNFSVESSAKKMLEEILKLKRS